MKGYEQYIKDVLSGKITTCLYIRQAVERFERFRNRPDIWFDADAVDDCITFIRQMKHYLGKSAGKHFILEPWQEFFFANIVGLKWKKDDTRVCREVYLQMARKQGKTAMIAALALYFLIADGEASPEIACLATSREQAHICFDMIGQFAKSLDPNERDIKHYRNYIKLPANNGNCKVFSSDSSRLDGLNISLGIIDEAAALKDNLLYSVIKSSMGMREAPLLVQITTPQFDLTSPAYLTYQMGIEVLAQVKDNDSFFPFLFTLDIDDKWDDEDCWIKSNPNLGVTVTKDFLAGEVRNAKNDSTQEVPVKIKNIGIWCSSSMSWIAQELVAQYMQPLSWEDFRDCTCYIGIDLGSVSDFTSMSVMIPKGDKKYFKTLTFIPRETLENHADRELYQRYVREGSMIVTPGNVCDYDYVLNKIMEIGQIMGIEGVYYDKWNSTQFAINATDAGLNMQPFSQAVGNFNAPTKEFERLLKEGALVIDKSSNVLWQIGNVELRLDINGNAKPDKSNYKKKIDSVISMITALGGYLQNPVATDFDIFIL